MAKNKLQVKDLLTDPNFIQWVNDPDPQLDAYWQKWLIDNPGYAGMVEEAKELLAHLQFQEATISEETIENIREKIDHRIGSSSPPRRINKFQIFWKGIAASLLLFILGYLIIHFFFAPLQIQKEVVTTDYGETKEVELPDNSYIILNANSSITYPGNIGQDDLEKREIWLEGEAFFNVNELKGNASAKNRTASFIPFIVHTKNMDIEVLGTTFNVNQRGKHTSIVLNSGKVKLNNLPPGINNFSSHSITMAPGEYVKVYKDSAKINRKQVNPELYTSWKDNRLAFDNKSLGEIAETLFYNYGYKVEFQNKTLKEYKFTGSTPTDNLQILFKAIEESFRLEVDVNKEHKIITMSKSKNQGNN